MVVGVEAVVVVLPLQVWAKAQTAAASPSPRPRHATSQARLVRRLVRRLLLLEARGSLSEPIPRLLYRVRGHTKRHIALHRTAAAVCITLLREPLAAIAIGTVGLWIEQWRVGMDINNTD